MTQAMHPLQTAAWLAVAGALGTLSRYGMGHLAGRFLGNNFPWGTWLVNASGCLLYGLVWSLAEQKQLFSPQQRLVLLAGFFAAYTTFSTYIFEVSLMLGQGQWLAAAGNFLGQNLLGFAMLALGISLAKF
jgi:CrcB protein